MKNIGWKTITGAVLAFLAWVSSPEVLAVLPPKVAAFIGALGLLLTMLGVVHKQAKTIEAVKENAQATKATTAAVKDPVIADAVTRMATDDEVLR